MSRPCTPIITALIGLTTAAAVLSAPACLDLASAGTVVAAAVDGCRDTTSNLDLNGDGYDDAVVGDPYAAVNGRAEAGAIIILYGDADGRIGEGRRALLTQDSVPGSSVEAGDHFGWAVAVDDATGDGCADILVGSPGEDWAGRRDAGIVHLISFPSGSSDPGTPTAVLADQSQVAGAVETGDEFGSAVALSNQRGGDEPLGAIGAPGEDLHGLADAGVVNTFSVLGSPHLADQREQGQRSDRWLPGTAGAGDRFGASVLVAPLTVTDGTDLGVEPTFLAGAPGDTVIPTGATQAVRAGSVTIWEPVTGYQQLLTQASPNVPGTAESGDQFGFSMAFHEGGTAGSADRAIAVGSPGEDVGAVIDAGAVTVLFEQSGAGLTRGRAVTQNTTGFAGSAETGDHFGHAVALRPGTPSQPLLVVGIPDEDIGSVKDAGMAQTAALDLPAATITPIGSYTENSPGTPGTVATGNRFGLAVAAMQGIREVLFTVSSPHQKAGSVWLRNQAGQTRSWIPGVDNVPSLTSGRFGWSVSALSSQG